MTDPEYGSVYAVYITGQGMQYLTNETSIGIMRLLERKSMTVTELAGWLGCSRTSVQSNIMRLERRNFVTSRSDASDRRKVVYMPAASLILTPCCPDVADRFLVRDTEALQEIPGGDNVPSPSILVLTAIEAIRLGVDMRGLLIQGGMMLARNVGVDRPGEGYDRILERFREVMTRSSLEGVTAEYRDGMVDIVAAGRCDGRRIGFLTCGLAAGFAIEMLETCIGRRHVLASSEVRGDGSLHLRIAPCSEDIPVDPAMRRPASEVYEDSQRFAVYNADGRSLLLGNEMQIDILRLLESAPATPGELAEALDAPTVTVRSNLSKLALIGLIEQETGGVRPQRYLLRGTPVVKEMMPQVMRQLGAGIGRIERDVVYGALFEMLNSHLRFAGKDVRCITYRVGKRVAERIITENPGISTSDFLEKACSADGTLGHRPEIIEYVPLTVKLGCLPGSVCTFDFVKPFYQGLLKHGLLLLTGDEYDIRFPPPRNNPRRIPLG